MFLVGKEINGSMSFICRDGPGSSFVSEAIDYGSYENALRVATEFNEQVVEVKISYSYSFVNKKGEQVFMSRLDK